VALLTKTIPVNTWRDLTAHLSGLRGNWVFRGMPNSGWSLESSLERYVPKGSERPAAEEQITAAFKARAFDFFDAGKLPETELEWWAMMQHH
jgi:hypothetical protein